MLTFLFLIPLLNPNKMINDEVFTILYYTFLVQKITFAVDILTTIVSLVIYYKYCKDQIIYSEMIQTTGDMIQKKEDDAKIYAFICDSFKTIDEKIRRRGKA